MSQKRSEYLEYILELLEPSGGITAKRMFGGYAIYKFGIIIALIIQDEIYFKVDDSNISDYKKLNSRPFSYRRKDKIIKMSYWILPIEILEDNEKLIEFIDKSYQIALRAKK